LLLSLLLVQILLLLVPSRAGELRAVRAGGLLLPWPALTLHPSRCQQAQKMLQQQQQQKNGKWVS
jgi:hypothetical protein